MAPAATFAVVPADKLGGGDLESADSISQMSHLVSAATRRKQSAGKLGRPQSEAHRAARSAAVNGCRSLPCHAASGSAWPCPAKQAVFESRRIMTTRGLPLHHLRRRQVARAAGPGRSRGGRPLLAKPGPGAVRAEVGKMMLAGGARDAYKGIVTF